MREFYNDGMRGLKDKVVIVTGGAGGIGSAVCARFKEEGSKVAVFDLSLGIDITNQSQVIEEVKKVEQNLGPVDVLVNNAGWDKAAPFLETDAELWRKIVAINLMGPLNMHHAVLTGMAARGRGRIVNVASDAGRVGSSGESVYSACKGGLIAFSKTMAREMAAKRIGINVVCPGPTDTALFRDFAGEGERGEKLKAALTRAIPFGRLGQPEDAAGMIVFLASDDAGFITGQVISVSGGLTMAG
jgi:2-hydroxycyclohexanecarboxyl-CoA dehydrogenase